MRVRAAHDVRVRLPGLVDVVGVAAGAAQELRVFRALDALTNAVIRGQGRNSRAQMAQGPDGLPFVHCPGV